MHRLLVAALALTALVSTPPVVAEEQTEARTFVLHHIQSRGAATIVRTIVGIPHLAIKDEHTLELTDTRARLELTAELLTALDVEEIAPTKSLPTDDDSVIAIIPLQGASSKDVTQTMLELKIRRSATVAEPPVAVVLRDTPEQVALAKEALDKAHGQQQD